MGIALIQMKVNGQVCFYGHRKKGGVCRNKWPPHINSELVSESLFGSTFSIALIQLVIAKPSNW